MNHLIEFICEPKETRETSNESMKNKACKIGSLYEKGLNQCWVVLSLSFFFVENHQFQFLDLKKKLGLREIVRVFSFQFKKKKKTNSQIGGSHKGDDLWISHCQFFSAWLSLIF